MIDLYTAATPNGFKVSIALEELGLPYTVRARRPAAEASSSRPEFLRISPNNKIPAIVDHERRRPRGLRVRRHLDVPGREDRAAPAEGRPCPVRGPSVALLPGRRTSGPTLGPVPPLRQLRDREAALRDRALHATRPGACTAWSIDASREARYLAGAEYTIADIANLPWLLGYDRATGSTLAEFPHLARWIEELKARPAVAARARRAAAERRADGRQGPRSALRQDPVRAPLERSAGSERRPLSADTRSA